jgi:uncharacterized membrane protein
VHHVPSRINASSVIGLLGDELKRQLEREFPPADERGTALAWPVDPVDEGDVIRLDESGSYLRIVDYDGLVALAQRSDRRFETLVVPGAFSVPGAPIARVHGGPLDDACLRELRGMFSWGADRTAHQDLLFIVDQLAEIAGKALSTGVNDQFTALLCIDQMERVLCAAARRREPDAVRGADGTGRLLARHVSLPDVADRFLVPLREFSRGDLITTDRLLAMIERCVSLCAAESTLRRALGRHCDAILEDAESALPAASQKKWLAVRRTERNGPRAADPSAQSGA